MYGKLSDEDLVAVFDRAIEEFAGDGGVLSSAIGAAVVGRRVGWRVLLLMHSPATIKRYEKVLGMSYRDICPPEGDKVNKAIAYGIAKRAKSFWAVITGNEPGRSCQLQRDDLFAGMQ